MKVLVIGSGGREHALAWGLSRSASVDRLFCLPGSDAIGRIADRLEGNPEDVADVLDRAKQNDIDLAVVGPEAPLAAGLADALREAGVLTVGPGAEGAKLESSKAYARQLMRSHAIPSPGFRVFTSVNAAKEHVRAVDAPLVVKADGLAAGKGVRVCENAEEALAAIDACMVQGTFGAAGKTVVIEERLTGSEVSVLALTDGKTLLFLPPCRDHKRLLDADQGPNTGGMGAICPSEPDRPVWMDRVEEEVFVPLLHALRIAKVKYRGVLYAGLMLTPGGPRVLEFNVRFGDPEAQPLLARLRSDLLPLLAAVAGDGNLAEIEPDWDPRPAVCVVVAAPGYPESPQKGLPIEGIEEVEGMEDVVLFHAGTARKDGGWVTAGGRVLGITALGETMETARARAYEAVDRIHSPGMQVRRDIGLPGARTPGSRRREALSGS